MNNTNHPATTSQGVYVCTNKRCYSRGQERQMMLPAEIRRATGRPVMCADCGSVLFLRRTIEVVEALPAALPEQTRGVAQ